MGPDKAAWSSRPDETTKESHAGQQNVSGRSLQTQLEEERQRRQNLERKLSEVTEENRKRQLQAEQRERFTSIQSALQNLGVRKPELVFRLVKENVFRGEDGALYAEYQGTRVPYVEYLRHFVTENPEFLPPRIPGGSGASSSDRHEITPGGFDIDRIRPGMSQEELAQAWKEVARLAGHNPNTW